MARMRTQRNRSSSSKLLLLQFGLRHMHIDMARMRTQVQHAPFRPLQAGRIRYDNGGGLGVDS